MLLRRLYCCVLLVLAVSSAPAFADTPLVTIASFGPEDGDSVNFLMSAPDGYIYGLTEFGGEYEHGTVFRMKADGSGFKTLHSFNGFDGAIPATLMLSSDGNFYGTTATGGIASGDNSGASGVGVLFKMTPDGAFTLLHTFIAAIDGVFPVGPLAQTADGTIYGTTGGVHFGGPSDSDGSIFRYSTDGTFNTLLRVNFLYGLVLGADGNLYSSIYRITPAGVMTQFVTDPPDAPQSLIVGDDGNLYGASTNLFMRITLAGVVTVLHTFDDGDGTGAGVVPLPGLAKLSDGSFVGITLAGSTMWGAIFRVTPAGVTTKILSLAERDGGGTARAILTQGSDGRVFYTRNPGHALHAVGSDAVPVLMHTFAATVGTHPKAGVVQDDSGGVYGSVSGGGGGVTFNVPGPGGIFHIAPDGTLSFPVPVMVPNGVIPVSALSAGPGSLFYGASSGVLNDSASGAIFSLDASGMVTALTHPNGGRADPILGSAGNLVISGGSLYATHNPSPSNSLPHGSVVQYPLGGNDETVLHTFGATDGDGLDPESGLLLAADGLLYGTTVAGGANDKGTLYRLSTTGTGYTILHSFTGADGAAPRSELVQASDGSLWGTTRAGGTADKGTVFRITPAGVYTLMHSFIGADGATPTAALTQGDDGNWYGVVSEGGANNLGSFFRITPAGVFTALHSFAYGEPANPMGKLLALPQSVFLGTSSNGGLYNDGTVFAIQAIDDSTGGTTGGSGGDGGGGALGGSLLLVLLIGATARRRRAH